MKKLTHKHHIIPKHMGGTDDPENIVELTVEEHANAHRLLYEKHGKLEDYLAWKGLSGMISKQEILYELQKIYANKGGKVTGKKHAESGHCAKIAHLGGKAAAGMPWWHNPITKQETRSFESPGEGWIRGHLLTESRHKHLIKNSTNRKGSTWFHNPNTGETKMIKVGHEEIPNGFVKGRSRKKPS